MMFSVRTWTGPLLPALTPTSPPLPASLRAVQMYMVRPTFTESDYCRMHSRLGCRGRDLLARLEEAHGDRGSVFRGRLDLDSVAVMGYSFGGTAAVKMLLEGDARLRSRVKALVPIAADPFTEPYGWWEYADYTAQLDLPILAPIGLQDGVYPPDSPWLSFRNTQGPALFPVHQVGYHLPAGDDALTALTDGWEALRWPAMTDHRAYLAAFLALYVQEDARALPVVWGRGPGSLAAAGNLAWYRMRPRVELSLRLPSAAAAERSQGSAGEWPLVVLEPGDTLEVPVRVANAGGPGTASPGGPASAWRLQARTSDYLSDARKNARDAVKVRLSAPATAVLAQQAAEEVRMTVEVAKDILVNAGAPTEVLVEVQATSARDGATAAFAHLTVVVAPKGHRAMQKSLAPGAL